MRWYCASTVCLGFCVVWLCAVPVRGQAGATDVEQRVNAILTQMTLDEKLAYIGGTNSMYIRGIPRLGVPAIYGLPR